MSFPHIHDLSFPPTIRRLYRKLTALPKEKRVQLFVIGIITFALVPTILATKTIQNIQSKADQKRAIVSCEKVSESFSPNTIYASQSASFAAKAQNADRTLDRAISEYIRLDNQAENDNNDTQKKKEQNKEKKQRQVQLIRSSAQSRKLAYIQLMYADPNNALNLTKNDKNKMGYYLLEDNCKAIQKNIQGEIVISHYDYKDKTTQLFYEVVDQNGDEISLHTSNVDSLEELEPETQIQVKGIAIDDEFVTDATPNTFTSSSRSVDTTSAERSKQNIARTTGKQRTLAVFAYFQDNKIPARIDSNKGKLLNTIKDYFSETSYGTADFLIDATPWIEIPVKVQDTCGMDGKNIIGKIKTGIDKKVAFNQYDRIVIFAPFGGNKCGYLGMANLGLRPLQTDEGNVKVSMAWIDIHDEVFRELPNDQAIARIAEVAVHEIGHGLGLMHAQAYLDCPSSVAKDCKVEEYGDSFNVMGDRLSHFGVQHLEFLGWLRGESIKTVSEGTFDLLPLSEKKPGLKALKVPRGDNDFLYIEFRQPLGFDSIFNEYRNGTNVYSGALIRTRGKNSKGRASALIDATNQGYYHFFAAFLPGKEFRDPKTGITVKVISETASSLKIQIIPANTPSTISTESGTISPTPPFTPSLTPLPTLSVTPSPAASLSATPNQ